MLAIVISTASQTLTADAYALSGCKWPGGSAASVYWTYDSSVIGNYYDAALQSTGAWTTYTTIYMILRSSPYITVRALNYGNTNFVGIYYNQCDPVSGNFGLYATSDWNTYWTGGWGIAELKNTMVHELGHNIALAHFGSMPCPVPIMYNGHDSWTLCVENVPQQDDINGVNAVYHN
jgi:hypothetical protein